MASMQEIDARIHKEHYDKGYEELQDNLDFMFTRNYAPTKENLEQFVASQRRGVTQEHQHAVTNMWRSRLTHPGWLQGALQAIQEFESQKSRQITPPLNNAPSYEQLEQRIQELTDAQPATYQREGRAGFQRLEKQIVALENEVVSLFPESRLGKEIAADRLVEQQQNYSVAPLQYTPMTQPKQAQQVQKEILSIEQDFTLSF